MAEARVEFTEVMDDANEVSYKPPAEFQEDTRDPLIELNLTDSTELWLVQWPIDQPPDFDGQEVSLKLHCDGHLASFEGSSGKSYDMVSFTSQDPDATVFLSTASESKIVGKISRRVSLVHYPEPSKLQKQNTDNLKQMYGRSFASSMTNSAHHYGYPTQVIRSRHSQSVSGYTTATHGSGRRSSLSEVGELSKPPKRRHVDAPTRSMGPAAQDLRRGHSVVTSSGSLEHSQGKKSKKKRKNEG